MPKGVRKVGYAMASDNDGEYITHNPRGKIGKTRDKQDLRILIGDKNTSELVRDSKKWHESRRKAKADRAKADKAKADKEGKDAIELVRRKKSTYRDDYKD